MIYEVQRIAHFFYCWWWWWWWWCRFGLFDFVIVWWRRFDHGCAGLSEGVTGLSEGVTGLSEGVTGLSGCGLFFPGGNVISDCG